jgi:hypothetical protein
VVVYKHTVLGLKFALKMDAEAAEAMLGLAFKDASEYREKEASSEGETLPSCVGN